MAASDSTSDDSLYPIAVLIDELKNEDVQVIIALITSSELVNEPAPFLPYALRSPFLSIFGMPKETSK